ncbi:MULTISPECIES: CheR family methyltransferase [Edaphosphingomonas]|uniref:Protein-glutamate O-methyltransferase CheR n=2 Tax=Edaphosphingomonas TaxID=3423724 RepID=A0A2T4I637_9SPHN|nr:MULTISPECIES: protein-glutamate O-methyltransferase CheR [Sphingomonas]OHT20926.1 Chemotaxis protein methyltransferase Cher2 [Sphingomonas haloaromaticamans]PTD26072.1 protein-glutamate O-methyltransferase CheR [Sphingomonas fennica]
MELSPVARRAFAGLLKARTGQELSASRHWRIETALKPLLKDREFPSLDSLAAGLANPADRNLAEAVVEALLNHETFFFRDQAAFTQLMAGPIDALAAARAARRRLSIWCAGCSSGQEAYSLAMAFAEQGDRWNGWTIDIFGTDISAGVIGRASEGSFTQFEIQRGLPIRQMMRWFAPEGENWRATPELRRMVRFDRHNLLDAPPVANVDLILCRNVLLYFGAEERVRVFDGLAAAIASDGFLMLGAGETVLGSTIRFDPDFVHRGLYRPVA